MRAAGRERGKLELGALFFEDDGVHAVDGAVGVGAGEELLALDGAGDDVADERVLLGEVGSEVHFFPLELLADAEARKSEVGADGLALDEVEEPVWRG